MTDTNTIYLDNGATTAVAPEVRDAMLPWLGESWGNPSSRHRLGLGAARAIKESRKIIAEALGCEPAEVVFTSGGTEADALAVAGCARSAQHTGHIICSAIEHPAVLNSVRALEERGWRADVLPVDRQGLVDPTDVAERVTEETVLVSVMHTNNELGSIQPIAAIATAARRANPRLKVHTDAVQSFTKEPVHLRLLGVDLLSVSSHKIHGPMGVGALIVRKGTTLQPLVRGGGQELGMRSGTENVPGIVGFAQAVRMACASREADHASIGERRDRLQALLQARLPNMRVNGPSTGPQRACNNLHLSIPGVASESILHALEAEGVYGSAGSACNSRNARLSHVLEAVGLEARGWAHVRLTLSRYTTELEVADAAEAITRAVAELRR